MKSLTGVGLLVITIVAGLAVTLYGMQLEALADASGLAPNITVDVQAADFQFVPRVVNIKAGDTVRWTNTGRVLHTATGDTGLWDSGVLSSGQEFSFTFDQPGRYPYYCALHGGPGGIGMAGEVVVVASDDTPTPTGTATSTGTPMATPTHTATGTATPTETRTPTGTATATGTVSPTPGASDTSTATPTATGTQVPTATATATPETPTSTPTGTATTTATAQATATATATRQPGTGPYWLYMPAIARRSSPP